MDYYIITILENFLGPNRGSHNGQLKFDCPICSADKGMLDGDGKGNLEVNYYKDVFKCWVCKDTNSMSGSMTRLIKRFGNQQILNRYRLVRPEKFDENGVEKSRIVTLPDSFHPLKIPVPNDFRYKQAIKYLADRKITKDIIEKFNIGYTNSGIAFNRIVIPSYDEYGDLNYFVARWFSTSPTKIKYVNPEVPKLEIIFNENKINWDATIYLVEGAFDHIVIPNSIPLLGKELSPILLQKLYQKAKANIVVLLDGDAHADGKRLYHELNFGDLRGRIRICLLPKGDNYDPSYIYQQHGIKGIKYYLSNQKKLKE